MPSWMEPVDPKDIICANDTLSSVLRFRWHGDSGYEPLVVKDLRHRIQGVVGISDVLHYIALQSEEIHHLWPSYTVVLPTMGWSALQASVLNMPIGQFIRSRRGIVGMPGDWMHAVRLMSRVPWPVLYVQDRSQTLLGKITWKSLAQRIENVDNIFSDSQA